MVKIAIISTGASTAQGWVARPSRFSFIIWPQLAAPGSAAKPRKPEGGDQADRVGEPQAGLGQQRAGHVGQHLGDDHPGPLLAQRLGGDHEVARDDAQRDAAGDAGHARCVRGADEHDDHPRRGVLRAR